MFLLIYNNKRQKLMCFRCFLLKNLKNSWVFDDVDDFWWQLRIFDAWFKNCFFEPRTVFQELVFIFLATFTHFLYMFFYISLCFLYFVIHFWWFPQFLATVTQSGAKLPQNIKKLMCFWQFCPFKTTVAQFWAQSAQKYKNMMCFWQCCPFKKTVAQFWAQSVRKY